MAKLVLAGKKSELKEGQRTIVDAGGVAIAVFMLGGKYYAIKNYCVHKGGPVGEGKLDNEIITCPWHGWRYDVRTGVSVVDSKRKLDTYNVKTKGDEIFLEV